MKLRPFSPILGPAGRAALSLRLAILPALAAALTALALTAPAAPAAPPAEFGSQGSGAGQFSDAQGIAVEQETGDVYLLDGGNARVDKFSAEGNFLLAFGWGVADGGAELQTCGPQAIPPSSTCRSGLKGTGTGELGSATAGIAVDNSGGPTQGDIYVVDRTNLRVQRFGADGTFQLMIGAGVNGGGGNLCLAGEECQAGVEGTGPGEFDVLEGRTAAVGPTGILYIGNRERVQKFSPAGSFEAQVSFPGVGWVTSIVVDSSEDIYLSTSRQSGIHKYDASGTEIGEPVGPGSSTLIALGPDDQLLVDRFSEAEQSWTISAYAPDGQQLSSFPSPSTTGGGLAYGDTIERAYITDTRSVFLLDMPPGPLLIPGSEAAREIEPTSATLGATLKAQGAEAEYHFQYGLSDCSGGGCQSTPTQTVPAGFIGVPLSAPISGLLSLTTYHFRLLASSHCNPAESAEVCEIEGPDQTFTTLPPVSIDSTSASNVSSTAATLEAELNPHGLPSTYRFEYDTAPYAEGEPPHGTSTPTGSAGSGTTDVLRTAQLQGLQPTTTYHYRVVAENSLGEGLEASFGPDRSFTTQGAFASLLPDGRGWELVSPPDKHGVPLEGISEEGTVIQAAADGSGIAYAALGSIGAGAGNRSSVKSQLLSARTAAGWATRDVTTPHREPVGVSPGEPTEYRIFSPDLSLGALQPEGATLLSPQATERTPYLLQPDDTYLPLVTAANVPPETKFGGREAKPEGFDGGVQFVTANPDLSHVLLASPQLLTEDFEPGFEPGKSNIYEWSAGALRLVSQIPTGSATACGGSGCIPASEADQVSLVGAFNNQVRGAISTDGSRVAFTTTIGENRLYLRDLARAETLQLDAVQGGSGKSGGGLFQLASADGSRVFFTDDHRLTEDSTAKPNEPDLYMCQIEETPGGLACDLSDLTVNTLNRNEPADVQGAVIGAAEDGSSLYFVAQGALIEGEGAVRGDCNYIGINGGEGVCNLYRYDLATEAIRLSAVLSGADSVDWLALHPVENLQQMTARVSPNGRYLAFMSERPLTGYDNRDAKSGARDQEVFLFDAQAAPSEALRCASCNPTGARPRGVFDFGTFPGLLVDRPGRFGWEGHWLAASIPGWTKVSQTPARVLYQSRYLSNSGRLFFNAADSLVPQDTNGTFDVYQFEFPQGPGQPASNNCTTASTTYSPQSGGCASLITSGTSPEESAFLDASETGDDVFFLTASKLAPTDEDAALDVYDARSGGSSTPPVKPVECVGDGCQQPAVPPVDSTPGSLTFNGAGNVVECPKGKVKKHGKCVKQKKAKKAKGNKKRGKSQRSAKNRSAK